MSDVELLDMLFDSSSGILGDQLSIPLNNNNQNRQTIALTLATPTVSVDKHSTITANGMDLPLFPESDESHNHGDFDWSSNFFNSSLSLDGLDHNEFFSALMDTNVPDDVKEQKQQQQPQQTQFFDHAYSITPASPNSDSGVSTGPYSPSNSSNSIEDLPFDIERDLFAPLDLKSYEDVGDNIPTVDPMLLDSISECSSSPGLLGNESPINFDFEDFGDQNPSKSVKGLTISTDETTKVIKVLSVNGSHTSLLSSNHKVLSNSQYPELMLSDEEKNLLRKEGISLPSHLPLTREEEKILRSVRRRIRNKASARNSRRKKQDYMEALEKRVKLCTDEKRQLERKVTDLEKRNSSLIGQLKKLQKLVTDGTRQTAKTGTCAMILALSFALVLLPNYQSLMGNDSTSSEETLMTPPTSDTSGRLTRSLLSKPEDYITSVSQQERSFNSIPFLNINKMASSVSPAPNFVVGTVDHKSEYAHEPIDDPVENINGPVPALPSIDEKVIHMEITKLPDESSSPATGELNKSADKTDIPPEHTVKRRTIRMDLDDEL